VAAALAVCVGSAAPARAAAPAPATEPLRVATFNVSLYGQAAGEVLARLRRGDDPQARRLAEIIQRVRPDVLLLNEIDYDAAGEVAREFHDRYLAVPQDNVDSPDGPAKAIAYPHRFTAPTNTGRHSGFDLDRSGKVEAQPGSPAYGGDAWGFGVYPGQYGMVVLSRFPIDAAGVRTFQNFRWRDMPGARLPDDPATAEPADWFPAEALEKFPLSSKSHWDVPVTIDGRAVHLLASHPTPPVYDGAEDRNGRRNHDEVRFWADYVGPAEGSAYVYDDAGRRGGLAAGESFVVLGDLNGDPHDGDGPEGIKLLLAAPRLLPSAAPASRGGAEQAQRQGGANLRHRGDPAVDTADARDVPGPGNLRIDYVLPSADWRQVAQGVYWPTSDDPHFGLVGVEPFPSSDHRLVWIDLVRE
jgi:3-phytase